MGLFKGIGRILQRIKNPISLPEDIGKDLGIQILYNELSFKECIEKLVSSDCESKYLSRFMDRDEAELLFKSAVRRETFRDTSLFSYYIYSGWLAFKLIFDDQNRLRRIYLQHRSIDCPDCKDGLEMHL
ncbi:MAG: hypothetical protein S4CHLAM6_04270 [Chlamydiae bacterium]|nr:hypothetical protein [Chlamydiota bacterium]